MGFFDKAKDFLGGPGAVVSPWSALGSIVGGGIDYLGAKEQQASANQQADEQMLFQERMSNTAHEREVADLRRAGLNPILSASSGGASSPSGAMAPQVNTMAGVAKSIESLLSTAVSVNKTVADIENVQADTQNLMQDFKSKRFRGDSEDMKREYILPIFRDLMRRGSSLFSTAKDSFRSYKDEIRDRDRRHDRLRRHGVDPTEGFHYDGKWQLFPNK